MDKWPFKYEIYYFSPINLSDELKDYDGFRIVKETRNLEVLKFDKWINIHYDGWLKWFGGKFTDAEFKDGKLIKVINSGD
jgi:hypothetical protein